MATQRYTTEQIIHKLREADVLIGQGKTVAQACKQLGVTVQIPIRAEVLYSNGRQAATAWYVRHPSEV
ncbi:MAG: hypothetical protein ACLQO1_05355 [Steroidobacteraceae bacterium]